MAASLATFDAILKNQYLGPIREQLNNDVVLLQQLDKDQESVVGKNFTIPVHYAGNNGLAALGENGTLPTAGAQSYKETIVPMKYVYGRIQITGPSIRAARSDSGAFVRAIDSETKGLTRDMKKWLNKMLWGDGTGSTGKEVMGLAGIVSATSTLQGLAPATYTWWKANILGNGGTARAITENLLQTGMDTTEINSDGEVKLIMTTHGVSRAYQALLTATRQYVNTMDLKGGRKALSMNGKPLVVDKDAPTGKLFMLDTDALKIYELSDFDWMDQDGAILSRVPNMDAYEATLFRYFELGCSARNAQTLIEDLLES